MPTKHPLPVLIPQRLRRVPCSFAWIDHRLRSGGCLKGMSPEEIALVIVAHKLARIVWRLLTDNRPFRKRAPRRTKRA